MWLTHKTLGALLEFGVRKLAGESFFFGQQSELDLAAPESQCESWEESFRLGAGPLREFRLRPELALADARDPGPGTPASLAVIDRTNRHSRRMANRKSCTAANAARPIGIR